MIGRIAEEQRHGSVLAVTRTQEGARCDLDMVFQLSIADRPVTEFDRRTSAMLGCRPRQEVGQRSLFNWIVPADALWIELLAGIGHEHLRTEQMSFPGT